MVGVAVGRHSPVPQSVVVAAISWTIVRYLINEKETMLNFIPFAGPGGKWHREFELIGQLLQLDLPQTHTVAVPAIAVGRDHQPFGLAWRYLPIVDHQRRMALTANEAVS
jgi:hypothetical protein